MFGQRGIRVRSGIEESFDHGHAAIDGSQAHGCDARAIACGHVGASTDQQIRCFEVVVIDGPMECRGAIDLRCIDVVEEVTKAFDCEAGLRGFLVEQRPDCFQVAVHRCVCYLVGSSRTGHRQKQDQ